MAIGKYLNKVNEALSEFARKRDPADKQLADYILGVKGSFPKGRVFRRMGAALGVVAPYVGAWVLSDYFSGDISSDETIKEMYTLALFYGSSAIVTLTGTPVFSGMLGYKAGKGLDNLVAKRKINKKWVLK